MKRTRTLSNPERLKIFIDENIRKAKKAKLNRCVALYERFNVSEAIADHIAKDFKNLGYDAYIDEETHGAPMIIINWGK